MTCRPPGYTAPERAPTRWLPGLDVFGWARPRAAADDRRGAQHARGLQLALTARAGAAPLPRGIALRVRRPRTRTSPTPLFDVPLGGLLSDEFAAARRGPDHRQARGRARSRPATRAVREARSRGVTASDPQAGVDDAPDVADARATSSRTRSRSSPPAAGIVAPGYGFLLNNELTDFNFDSTTHPNRVEGGKRPRSSMCTDDRAPRDGKPLLALGSPGGSTIITTVTPDPVDRLDLGRGAARRARGTARQPAQHARPPAEAAFLDRPSGRLRARGHTFGAPARSARRPRSSSSPDGRLLAQPNPSAAAEAARRWCAPSRS